MNNKIMYNGQVLVDFDALADKYTRAEVDALVSAVFKYKGTVATRADLENIPTAELSVGDCYNVEADGANYAWTGTVWDKLSGTVDLSNYYTKTQVDNLINSIDLSAYYTKTQVDDKFSSKLDSSKVKSVNSSTAGDVYDVSYINTALNGKESTSNRVTSISGSSTDSQYPSAKCVFDTLGSDVSAILSNFAPDYDNTSTYAVDDYVIYNKLLYVCTTAVDTAEDFDSNKWTRTTVSQMINNNV